MTMLYITLDTQTASADDLKSLLQDGQILHAAGTINVRWNEFSAFELAQSIGLTEVTWEAVSDDTPGSLELAVWYTKCSADSILLRITEISGIEKWDMQSN